MPARPPLTVLSRASRTRLISRCLGALLALQSVSPAFAQQYVVRVPALISPSALQPMLSIADGEIDFGSITIGDSGMAATTLQNASDKAATLNFSDLPAPYGFSHDCVNPLPGGQNCALNFTFSPTQEGVQPGATLSISGGQLPLHIQLQGSGSLPLAALGEIKANTSADFGSVTLGSTQQRTFTFKNIGNEPATGVFATVNEAAGLSVASTSSCGTEAAPKNVSAGGTCSVTLNFGGNEPAALNDTRLTLAGGFQNSPLALGLTGTAGVFDVIGAWSSTSGAYTPISAHNYATTTVGYNTEFIARLAHRGSYGPLSVGYRLVGDTEHFSIVTVRRSNAMGGSCITGGEIATDKLSFTPCKSGSLSGGVADTTHQIEAIINYSPKSIGQHQVRVEPYSNNGSILPEPLVLNGQSEFNPEGKWSTGTAAVAQPDNAYLNFGQRSVDSSITREMFIMNVGTHGPLSIGLRLSGDVSQYRIASGPYAAFGTATKGCNGGVVLNADKTETTPCLADNKTNHQHIKFVIAYEPKAVGNHTLTVTPYTNNGSILPSPATFQGSAQFDAAGQWSSAPGALTPYPNNVVDFGGRTINKASATSSDLRYVYLLNNGMFGKMAASFRLEGDISEFDIYSAPSMVSNTGAGSSCDSSIVAGNKSTTTCTAADAIASTSKKHIYVTIRHNPKTLGTHTVRLIPTSNNGTQLPGEITLRGEGRFEPQARWSSTPGIETPLNVSNTDFGPRTINKIPAASDRKKFYLVNIGAFGPLAARFRIEGDTQHFSIQHGPFKSEANGSLGTCGASVSADKLSSTVCTADEISHPYEIKKSIMLTIEHNPKSTGTQTIRLIPETTNGTILPGEITLTGEGVL